MLLLFGVVTIYGCMGGGRNERRNENLYYQPPAGWSQDPQVLTNAPPARRRNHVWMDSWLIHYVYLTKQKTKN
jgi:hypothetical protein